MHRLYLQLWLRGSLDPMAKARGLRSQRGQESESWNRIRRHGSVKRVVRRMTGSSDDICRGGNRLSWHSDSEASTKKSWAENVSSLWGELSPSADRPVSIALLVVALTVVHFAFYHSSLRLIVTFS